MDKSIEAVRLCNFEYSSEILQTRIAALDSEVKIVGILINIYNIFNFSKSTIDMINCMNINKKINIADNLNGYKNIINLLKLYILDEQSKDFNLIPYWLFNENFDKKFDNINYSSGAVYHNISSEEYYKNIIANIYDQLQTLLYEKIVNYINKIKIDDYNIY